MIVWTIPDKVTIEMDAAGWWVRYKRKAYQFESLTECLCFLAGSGLIKYDQITFLVRKARERFQ